MDLINKLIFEAIDFLRSLIKSSFAQDVTILSSGTVISQAISLLSLPILTRVYSPSAFGVYALFSSIVTFLVSIISLQYERSIVLPSEKSEAYNLFVLTLFIILSLNSVIFFLIIILNTKLLVLIGEPEIEPWLIMIPFLLLLMGSYQVYYFWWVRRKKFYWISIIEVIQSLFMVGSQLVISSFYGSSSAGLISGYIIGQLLATIIMAVVIVADDGMEILQSIDIRKSIKLAKEYKKFPLFSSWIYSIQRIRSSLPVWFFSAAYGSTVAGYYSMSIRILYAPSRLIGRSVSRVLFQRVSEGQSADRDYVVLIEKVFGKLCLLGVLYMIGMTTLSFFLGFIFGPEWGPVEAYVRILVISSSLVFVSSSMSILLQAFNRQELNLLWQLISIVVIGVFLGASLLVGDPKISLFVLAFSYLILYIYYGYLISRATNSDLIRGLVFELKWIKKLIKQ